MTFSATVRVGWDRACPRRVVWLLALGLLAACDERVDFMPGDECELNTDCATPLVCRLGRCRVECRAQRDCQAGLECVRDAVGLGACQLPDETMCMRASDCEAPLVCHFGRCTNECVTDRDCPPGSSCVPDGDGASGCRDESMNECERTSDCVAMGLPNKVCAVDGRCREPCRQDWDCADGRACLAGPPAVCGWRALDGGIEGGVDGGIHGGIDGAMDGGADAGTDAMTSDAGAGVMPSPPPRLAASLQNTCAAPAGAPMRCWGANGDGQIGDGTRGIDRLTPAEVMLTFAESVRSLGVGHGHACASSGATLECWGDNALGQLGIDPDVLGASLTPRAVTLPAGTVDDVSLGRDHTCAIVGGALYCWGGNENGQLGLGDTAPRDQPTLVSLPEMATRIDTHSVHTCALLASGAIACFGANGQGQVGSGTGDVLTPALVPGVGDAVDVATGSGFTCALRRDGTVWCWGSDALGEIGQGGDLVDPPVAAPTQTSPIPEPVVQIAAGSGHACALTTGGEVYCWGDNFGGQAGQDRASVDNAFVPTRVLGLAGVDELAAGSEHTCARTAGGAHVCFGRNANGQLGDGSTTTSSTPVTVVGL